MPTSTTRTGAPGDHGVYRTDLTRPRPRSPQPRTAPEPNATRESHRVRDAVSQDSVSPRARGLGDTSVVSEVRRRRFGGAFRLGFRLEVPIYGADTGARLPGGLPLGCPFAEETNSRWGARVEDGAGRRAGSGARPARPSPILV